VQEYPQCIPRRCYSHLGRIKPLARKSKQVEGVYEKNKGSGIWYVRYRAHGKLVRKKIGTQAQAKTYVDKLRYVRSTGDGVVPSSAKQPVRTAKEVAVAQRVADQITLGGLCDGLLNQISGDPDRYRDQYNPPLRIARIRKAFGDRLAASIRPFEISNWLSALKTPYGERISDGTWNRYRTVFSSIYTWGKEQEKIVVNPVRDFKRRKEPDGVIRYLDPEEEVMLLPKAQVVACLRYAMVAPVPSLESIRQYCFLSRRAVGVASRSRRPERRRKKSRQVRFLNFMRRLNRACMRSHFCCAMVLFWLF
jgi:hypothetical protein